MPIAESIADAELARVAKFARVLDHYMVDPLLGFVLPGIGDIIGSLLGLYIVGIAIRRRLATVVVIRMLLNLAIDAGIGVVPVIGDIADIVFKANEMNLALLIERDGAGGKASSRDWLIVGGLAVVAAAVVGLAVWAVIAIVHALGHLFGQ
jgi:hypothetical protein